MQVLDQSTYVVDTSVGLIHPSQGAQGQTNRAPPVGIRTVVWVSCLIGWGRLGGCRK